MNNFIKLLFIVTCFFIAFLSCKNDISSTISENKMYPNPNDTSTYFFTSYYSNGKIKLDGFVKNSRKNGTWTEYYKDGNLRRNIYYNNGLIDDLNKERPLPTIIFDSDSLKVGVKTNIRAINLYSHEILSCKNGIISSYGGENDLFDFFVIPENTDSLSILYYRKDSLENDTLILKVSEIKDPSRYGLSKADIEGKSSVTVIAIKPRVIPLAILPVYE